MFYPITRPGSWNQTPLKNCDFSLILDGDGTQTVLPSHLKIQRLLAINNQNHCLQSGLNDIHSFVIMCFLQEKMFPAPNNQETETQ
jgi:hypothetical protein